MHSYAMGDRKSRTSLPSAKLFRLAHVRKLRECEQVAAVCYRVRSAGVEFLLVRTGSGHWTFPKGGVEPGLTHSQAAALEAFEEAGVHGRMEEASFARYVRRKGRSPKTAVSEIVTSAHLCEVLRLVQPQEADRNPTWFSAEKTKKKLLEGRTADFGAELIRVVDRAVARIRRSGPASARLEDAPVDGLQRVQIEAPASFAGRGAAGGASFSNSHSRESLRSRSRAGSVNRRSRGKILQIGPALVVNEMSLKRLPEPMTSNEAAGKKRE